MAGKKDDNCGSETLGCSSTGITLPSSEKSGVGVEETKEKTQTKLCNKKNSINFILNMTAVCLGVFLAFILQDCWHNKIEKTYTKKILNMTYHEALYNMSKFKDLHDSYSKDSLTINQTNISVRFANELLKQSNRNKFISDYDVRIIYNYIETAKNINEYIDYYCYYLFLSNLSNTSNNKLFKEEIIRLLEDFCADTIIIQDMLIQYDFIRSIDFMKQQENYKTMKEQYIKSIRQNKLIMNPK